MISGWKMRADDVVRRSRALLLLLLCAAAPAWAFDLTELMGLLARKKQGEGTFTEQRYVHGLEGPLSASGTLSFVAPDQMTRRTLTPRPESMVVDGNNLTLTRGNRTRSMALDSMPELLGMVEAMRGTLSGNGAVLQRYFRSTLKGSSAEWTLDLVPIDERLSAQVEAMRLSGKGGEVLGVEMEFRGGDRSVMTIVPQRSGAAGSTQAPAGRTTP
ncbi:MULTISPECIES: outer membrane lipoprotein carrier protein LolA [unclassified Variovorax]|uniref:outer membrane lipoprotein carrier protein LolA n=1 Tax=unclassified Variovorax TaxID=663243 RepID=UPI00210CF863|nr:MULTISPECIES: outer membrane lipoprotein carrier protein LolA [unclassified Variovorax]